MVRSAGIRPNACDIAFLEECGRYGTLSTTDAAGHYPDLKHNSVLRRLRLLAQNGLTQTTRLEVWIDPESNDSTGGRIPTLHSLTEQGADLVESMTGNRPQRVLRSRPTAGTFHHRREIVRVMRAFDQGCDAVGLDRPEWIMEQDAWATAPKALPPNQRRLLYHEFGHGVTCQPDIACRFTINQTTLLMFWEVDLSTEGRKQLRKASKSDGYLELFSTQAYRRYWPNVDKGRHFVLWATKTRRRFSALVDVFGEHAVKPFCRLVESSAFDEPSSLLTQNNWHTCDGDSRPIYRQVKSASGVH